MNPKIPPGRPLAVLPQDILEAVRLLEKDHKFFLIVGNPGSSIGTCYSNIEVDAVRIILADALAGLKPGQ